MSQNKYLITQFYINTFFIIGLLSTLAIRMIIVVKHLDAELVSLAWYCGIVGYVVFFLYRYYVTSKRRKLILRHALINKVRNSKEFSEDDRVLLEYIVSSIVKSKENYNYLFIFVTSIMAVIFDLVLQHSAPS